MAENIAISALREKIYKDDDEEEEEYPYLRQGVSTDLHSALVWS